MSIFKNLFGPKNNSRHHHIFAHKVLRDIMFSSPVNAMVKLAGDSHVELFDRCLAIVDAMVPNEKRGFSSKDIHVQHMLIDECPCAIVQMPEVRNPLEAYFIGIVSRLPLSRLDEAEGMAADDVMEYLTLEHSNKSGHPNVYGGWRSDGAHILFGANSEPTFAAFHHWLCTIGSRKCPLAVTPASAFQ
jgi:hypothetical protein